MAKTKKKILGLIKLQIPAGKANPSPPVGPALGQKGLEHYGILQGFQRSHPENGTGRSRSGRYYRF